MRAAMMVSRVEPWGFFIVMGLVLAGVVSTLWLRPVMNLTAQTLEWLTTPIRMLLT